MNNAHPIDRGITVLHVDDYSAFTTLVKTYLERIDPNLTILEATDGPAALQTLSEESVDCVLSDYDMPAMDGLSLLDVIRARDEVLPFILYTGNGSEEVASDAISAGVSDYMQKSGGIDHYELLAKRIRSHVEKYRSEERTKQTYEAIDTLDQGISILGAGGTYIHVNTAYAAELGYEPGELIGDNWTVLYRTEDIETVRDEAINRAAATGRWEGQTREIRKDGSEIVLDHKLQFTSGGLMVCTIGNPTSADGTEPAVQQRT